MVPSSRWLMASERITSLATTYPALRMTCAPPSLMPSMQTSGRASMHATIAMFAGGIGSGPLKPLA